MQVDFKIQYSAKDKRPSKMYTNWQQPGGYGNQQMQQTQYGQPGPPHDPNAMYQQSQVYQQWYSYSQASVPPGHVPGAVDGQPPLPAESNQPPLPSDTHGNVPPPLPNTAPPLPITAPPVPNIEPPQPPLDIKPPLPPEPPPDDDSKKELEPKTVEEVNKLTALQQQALQWQTINQQQPAAWQPPPWPQPGSFSQPPPPTGAIPPPGQLNQEWQALLNEEGEFIIQYEQWRKQYDDWKDQNKNHPNQEQFKQYESQWKQYEQQMEEKQAYIQNRKVQLQTQMAASQFPPPPQNHSMNSYGQGYNSSSQAPSMPPQPNGSVNQGVGFNTVQPPPAGAPGIQGSNQYQYPPPPSTAAATGPPQYPPPTNSAGGPGTNQFPPPFSTPGGTGPNNFPPPPISEGVTAPNSCPLPSISSASQSQFHLSTESNTFASSSQPPSGIQSQNSYPPSIQSHNSFQTQPNTSSSASQFSQQPASSETTVEHSSEKEKANFNDSSDNTQIPGFGEFPSVEKSEEVPNLDQRDTSQTSSAQSASSRLNETDAVPQGQRRNYFDSSRDNFKQDQHNPFSNRGFSQNNNDFNSESRSAQSGMENQNMSQYSFSQMQSGVKTSTGNERTSNEHYEDYGYDQMASDTMDDGNQSYPHHSVQENYGHNFNPELDSYGENSNFNRKTFDLRNPNADMMSRQRFPGSFQSTRPPFQGRFEGRPPFRQPGPKENTKFPFRPPTASFGNQRPGLLGAGPSGDYNEMGGENQDDFMEGEQAGRKRGDYDEEVDGEQTEFNVGRNYPMEKDYNTENIETDSRFSNMGRGPPGGTASRFGGPRNPFEGSRGARFEQPLRGRGFGYRGARFPGPRFDSPNAGAYEDHTHKTFQETDYDQPNFTGAGEMDETQDEMSGGPGDSMYGFGNKSQNAFLKSEGLHSGGRPFGGRGSIRDFDEPVTKMSKYDEGFERSNMTSFAGSQGQSEFGRSRGRMSNFDEMDDFDGPNNQMSRFDDRSGKMSRMGRMHASSEFSDLSAFDMPPDQMSDVDRRFKMNSAMEGQMSNKQDRYSDGFGGPQQGNKSSVPSLLDLDFRQPPPSLASTWKKEPAEDDDSKENNKDEAEMEKGDTTKLMDKTVKEDKEETEDVTKDETTSLASSSNSKVLLEIAKVQKQQESLKELKKLEDEAQKENDDNFYSEDRDKNENFDDFYSEDSHSYEFNSGPRPPFSRGALGGRFPRGPGVGQMRPGPRQMRPMGPGMLRAPGSGPMRPGSRFPPPQRGGPFGSQLGPRPPFDRMRGPRLMHQMGQRGGHNFPSHYDAEEEPLAEDEEDWNNDFNNDENFPAALERGRGAGRWRGMRARGRARGRGMDPFFGETEREFPSEEDDMNHFERDRRLDPWNERFEHDAFRSQDQFEDEGYPAPRRVPPRDYPMRDFPERDFPERDFPDQDYPDPHERRPEFSGRRDPFFDRDRFSRFSPPPGPHDLDFERRRGFGDSARRGREDIYRDEYRDRETFSPSLRERSMMDRPGYDDRPYRDRPHMDDRALPDRPHLDRFPLDRPFRDRHLLERSRLESPRPGDRMFEHTELIDYGHKPQSLDNEKESQPYVAPEVIDYAHGRGSSQRDMDKPDDRVDDMERRLMAKKSNSRDTGRRDEPGRRDDRSDRDRDRGRNGDRYDSRDGKRPPPFPHESREKLFPKPEVQKAETVKIEDLIYKPGRTSRPQHMVFIMRGLPGAGKTYVSKLIREKEIANGGHAPRMLCLDDYFMVEVEKKEKDAETGKMVTRKILDYEYEPEIEDAYRQSLLKSFKKTIDGGLYPFIIFDAVNDRTKHFEDFWSYAKSKGFQVYVAEIQADVNICSKRNTHKRSLKEIEKIKKRFDDTPKHYLRLDTRGLLQEVSITEVEMEDSANDEGKKTEEVPENTAGSNGDDEEAAGGVTIKKSKWELETSGEQLDKLDGIRHGKRRRSGDTQTFEEFLQLADEYYTRESTEPGRKRVRWADIEERKDQLRRREIGFVVGQTQRDWERITDNSYADRALNKTKYI